MSSRSRSDRRARSSTRETSRAAPAMRGTAPVVATSADPAWRRVCEILARGAARAAAAPVTEHAESAVAV